MAWLPDSDGEWDSVRLWSDFDLGDTSFERVPGGWQLRLAADRLPPVDRLEYLFEVDRNGATHTMLDPGNPRRVGGAFGDHSWWSFGYHPPAWLTVMPVYGERQDVAVADTPVGEVHLQIWSPFGTDPDAELPLLLSHDGPEMDTLGELTRFVAAKIACEDLPPMRVGLLAPGPRNERYAANPAYADTLCEIVVPLLRQLAPTAGAPVLMGQSLGALAALYAEWTHPGTFGGLLLQSGSFFTLELDAQESGFSHWDAVSGFVSDVLNATRAPSRPPIGICYGTAEDNAANNRQVALALTKLGCDVRVGEVRDGHNYTCWRDLLDPNLTDLLRRA